MRRRLLVSLVAVFVLGGLLGPSPAWAGAEPPETDPLSWHLTGNPGTVAGTNFVGTTDNVALEVKVNSLRALRVEPGSTANLIGGHPDNAVTAGVAGATIGGGGASMATNRVTDGFGTVAGGVNNEAGGGGGTGTGEAATVGGGVGNTASGLSTTVGGGNSNTASDFAATVGGGDGNTASVSFATVGGGDSNTASGNRATVGGGNTNTASGNHATVGGGDHNTASENRATVGGGEANNATVSHATIGGGNFNDASGIASFVGGGVANIASALRSTLSGGAANDTTDDYSVVAGGRENIAGDALGTNDDAAFATVGGGLRNSAMSPYSTVVGGFTNTTTGTFATVVGGNTNSAGGSYALAAGRRAQASNVGSFVWADSRNFDFASQATNQFSARATGGVRFVSGVDASGNPTSGVTLAPGGGSWSSLSDRAAKLGFRKVDAQKLLQALASLPMSTWSYKAQGSKIRHIGPVAQDFFAAFGVGEDERHISGVDADGVLMAAVQALYERIVSLEEGAGRAP